MPPQTVVSANPRPRAAGKAGVFLGVATVVVLSGLGAYLGAAYLPDTGDDWRTNAGRALFGVYGLSYLVLPIRLWRSATWIRVVMCVWMTLLSTGVVAVFGFHAILVFLFSIAITAVSLPVAAAVTINSAVLLGICSASLTIGRPDVTGSDLAVLISIAVTATATGQLLRTVSQLRDTRAELARLAVVNERNRLARDLHDVLGHSLTTISVKAGLARRLVESGMDDRARVIAEVSDSERLARQAMTEVRAVVSEYRASLVTELAGVREALDAAGIHALLPESADAVPADLQPAFAYVLREGVTNIMRHSRATACEVRIGPDWIEIIDNGPVEAFGKPGNGLTGLSERLAVVGGVVSAAPQPGGNGFCLRANVSRGAT
ncbi:MAG: sensor histidine kinase [Stackebrandtia sp.]